MSGVNGGIDYEIDLGTLPPALARRVRYVQDGPDSPTELIAAAGDIAGASAANPQMLPVLVDMLGFNNPVAANVAIDALVGGGKASVPSLLRGVAAFNYSVNAYALRALGRIGDPSVLDVCIACSAKGPIPNVRRAACKALAGLRLAAGEDAAERAYETLTALADAEPDWGVRYAAIVALEGFSSVEAVSEALRARAVTAVRGAANGESCVLTQDGVAYSEDADGEGKVTVTAPVDPTVAARATVALEVMLKTQMVTERVQL